MKTYGIFLGTNNYNKKSLYWMEKKDAKDRNNLSKRADYEFVCDGVVLRGSYYDPNIGARFHIIRGNNGNVYLRYSDFSVRRA